MVKASATPAQRRIDRTQALALTGVALLLSVGPTPPTTIMVTTPADIVNGDVSSVASLVANPGADGISLREAVEATNNDPAPYTILFSTPLTITIGSPLVFRGGNVGIEGPATLVARSDITPRPSGFQISSSGNRLLALSLDGFLEAVEIRPVNKPVPVGVTYANNSVEKLTIRGADKGIKLSFYSLDCDPCQTHNTWVNTTIADNVIEASRSGIHVSLMSVVGDLVDGVTITGNTLRIGTAAQPDADGPPLQIDVAGNSISSRIRNVLIAHNTFETVQAGGDGAIFIGAGLQRARQSVIEDVRIVDNRIQVARPSPPMNCCHGIVVDAGSDYFAFDPQISGSPDDNLVRRVEVSDNQISGALLMGVGVRAGTAGGGSRNRVESVRVSRNTIFSNVLGGIHLTVGQVDQGRIAAGNSITDVEIDANSITTGDGQGLVVSNTAGIVLLGGANGGRDGLISNIRITGNSITTAFAGVGLIGGLPGDIPAHGNSVVCVRLSDSNRIFGAATPVFAQANMGSAVGNSVTFTMPDIGSFRSLLEDRVVDVDDSNAAGC